LPGCALSCGQAEVGGGHLTACGLLTSSGREPQTLQHTHTHNVLLPLARRPKFTLLKLQVSPQTGLNDATSVQIRLAKAAASRAHFQALPFC